jgi:hypothetical protein
MAKLSAGSSFKGRGFPFSLGNRESFQSLTPRPSVMGAFQLRLAFTPAQRLEEPSVSRRSFTKKIAGDLPCRSYANWIPEPSGESRNPS